MRTLLALVFGGLLGTAVSWSIRAGDAAVLTIADAALAPTTPGKAADAPRPPPLPPLPKADAAPARIVLPESAIVEAPGLMPEVQLSMPLADVDPAQLSDQFDDARGEGRGHEAIDIAAPLGTPVLAVDAGVVAKLFTSVRGGLTVYQFDTRSELAYYYAHLDAYAEGLAEGQVLARGDLIGYVGFTGNANPAAPHLHFAVFRLGPEKLWWKGTAINPYPLLGGHAKQ